MSRNLFVFEIQGPDFECTPRFEAIRAEFSEVVKNHNWNQEFDEYKKMVEKDMECCYPSIYLRYDVIGAILPDSPMLHLFKVSEGDNGFNFLAWGFPRIKKGFFGFGGEKTVCDLDKEFGGERTLNEFISLANIFFDGNFDEILEL